MSTSFLRNSLVQRLANRKNGKNKKANGFTMIELMIVVAIIGVLTAIGLPELSKSQDRAKQTTAQATLTNAAKECSLSLIMNGDDTDYTTTFSPAVTGTCEADGTLAITATDGAATDYEIDFNGTVPAVVAEVTGG